MIYGTLGIGIGLMVAMSVTTTSLKGQGDSGEKKDAPSHQVSAKATFAGGCFWCMEPPFEEHEGVLDVVSGYTGGSTENPTYEEVCSGVTGHLEAVEVTYDPERIGYDELLRIFWRQIDPTDPGGQFADRGPQYRTAIFYHDREQRILAEQSKKDLEESGYFSKPLVTEIMPARLFFKAEEEHQDYYTRCPLRYGLYRAGSGREAFLRKTWTTEDTPVPEENRNRKQPSEEDLREKLTPLQYQVTRRDGTEPAFRNKYWDNNREGIYVDIISGEPLFSSRDKYDSGTGWPSFSRPLSDNALRERLDRSHGMERREVRSSSSDSHLGHVFPDGPAPTGLRYCMNSAGLRFIPLEDLEKEGYGEYRGLFVRE